MRSVLITGASGGIGRATARLFAKQGYAVAVHYHRSRETAESLIAGIGSGGGQRDPRRRGRFQRQEVAEMVRQTESVFGEISVFIHNAGTASQKLLTDLPPEEWRALMGVHLDGAYYGCRHVIPGMVRRKRGKIPVCLPPCGGGDGGVLRGRLFRGQGRADRADQSARKGAGPVFDPGQLRRSGGDRYRHVRGPG